MLHSRTRSGSPQKRRDSRDRFSDERRVRNESNDIGRRGYRESDNIRSRFNDEYDDREENFRNRYSDPYQEEEEMDDLEPGYDREGNYFRNAYYEDEDIDSRRRENHDEVWGVHNGSRQYGSGHDHPRTRADQRRYPEREDRRFRNTRSGSSLRRSRRDISPGDEMGRPFSGSERTSRNRRRRNTRNERSQIENYPRSHRNPFEKGRIPDPNRDTVDRFTGRNEGRPRQVRSRYRSSSNSRSIRSSRG